MDSLLELQTWTCPVAREQAPMPTGPDRIRPDPTGGFGTPIGGVPTGSDRTRPDPTGSDRIRPQHFLWVYGFLFSSVNYYISRFLLFYCFLMAPPARGVREGCAQVPMHGRTTFENSIRGVNLGYNSAQKMLWPSHGRWKSMLIYKDVTVYHALCSLTSFLGLRCAI